MKRLLVIMISLYFILIFPLAAFASENNDNLFIIQKDELVDRDVFAGGSTVKIHGNVNGDVFVVSGDFENTGDITGDIILGGGNARIAGTVDGNLRIGAGKLFIDGEIGRNVTALSGDLYLNKDSAVNGSLNAFAENLVVDGFIGGDMRSGAQTVRINGVIKGNVEVESSDLQFGPHAKIEGNLTYTSRERITIPEGVVLGEVTEREPKASFNLERNKKQLEKGLKIFNVVKKAIAMLSYLIIGTILTLVFTNFSRKTAVMLEEKPWHSLGIGFLGFIIIPIASILLMITVIGIPVGIIALLLYGLLLYLAKLPCALWIGNKILKGEEKPLLPMLLGIFLLKLVSYIPYLGGFVSFVAIIFGIGSILVNVKETIEKSRKVDPLI